MLDYYFNNQILICASNSILSITLFLFKNHRGCSKVYRNFCFETCACNFFCWLIRIIDWEKILYWNGYLIVGNLWKCPTLICNEWERTSVIVRVFCTLPTNVLCDKLAECDKRSSGMFGLLRSKFVRAYYNHQVLCINFGSIF